MELDIDFSGITINDTNTNNKVVLDSSSIILTGDAKVGIGVAAPNHKLDVDGDINFTGTLYKDGSEFSGGGGAFTIDSGNAYYTDGNVGIGTNTPANKLSVPHTDNTSSDIPTSNRTDIMGGLIWRQPSNWGGNTAIGNKYYVENSSYGSGIIQRYNIMMRDSDSSMWLSSPEKIQFEQGNGVNVMAIVNQNVGIGTTNPACKLHVKDSSSEGKIIIENESLALLQLKQPTSNKTYNIELGRTDGELSFRSTTGEKLRIKENGQVGIGTTSPENGYKLHIKGTHSSGVLGRLLLETTDWSSVLQLKSGSNSNYIYTNLNGDLYFNTTGTAKAYRFLVGSSEKMHINNNGYVGIGTTNPTHPLELRDGVTPISDHNLGKQWRYFSNPTHDQGLSNYNTHNNINVSLKSRGSIWIVGSDSNSYFLSSSDKRIKKDIEIINDDEALNIINNLETVKYNYTDPGKNSGIKTIGFIAQDVQKVIPNAVTLQTECIPDEIRVIENPIWIDCSYSTIHYKPKFTYTETVTYQEGPLLDNSDNLVLDQFGNQIMDPSAIQVVDPSGIEHIDPSGIVIEEWHPKWKLQIPDLDMNSNNTGRCRFYFSNDISGNDEIMKELALDISSNDTFEAIDSCYNNVFFYGKEVNDFHTLDKAQIFALHHSGIQELSRENNRLKDEITTLKNLNTNILNRLEKLEEQLNNS
tara:strand:+ start:236 stop:2320 length:2085 start_codon:yes stop_codon:yes gene_type:complete